jgi:hypothetical protein
MNERILHTVEGDPGLRTFWCGGCQCGHYFRTEPSPPSSPFAAGDQGSQAIWSWDGNEQSPTVSPSILVRYNGHDAGVDGAPPQRCHLFIRSGHIDYLSDCTHALAGKTVPMEPW